MPEDYPTHYLAARTTYTLLVLATLAGMLRGRRARACLSFQAFLVWELVIAVPTLLDAATWWNWRWVLFTDAIEAILVMAVALELAHKALGAMPPGSRFVSHLFSGALGVTAVVLLVLAATSWTSPPRFVAGHVKPRKFDRGSRACEGVAQRSEGGARR